MRLKSIFTNSFGILFSRIAGLVRTMLLASVLGQSVYSDMFLVAFKLPNLFRRIFAEGAFVQAFMPSFVASRNKGVFAVATFRRFLLFIVVASMIVSFFPEFFTTLIASGLSDETIAATAPLTAITFWYLSLIFIVTFLGTLLQYREHFATTAFATVFLNLAMIAALLYYRDDSPQTVTYALAISVIIGGILQVLVHIFAINKYKLHKLLLGGWKYRKTKDIVSEEKKFNTLFIPAVWGSSTPQINAFLDTFLASFLVVGSISALTYANLIFTLPLALIAIAASTALFPSISKALANGREAEAYDNLGKAFWLLFSALSLAMLGGIMFAEPIVWLLFESGKFTEQDTIVTAKVLTMYMVGLVPFGLAKLFSLYLYASHRQGKAAKIATISLVVNIIASLSLMKPMGAAGLALAGSLGGWVLFVLTAREIGTDRIIKIIKSKKLLYLSLGLFVSALLFYTLNSWLVQLIRHMNPLNS